MTSENRSPRRDSWWRTAPVLTIAVLALVMSTAGGAYAVAKNSIGTKQLKNNAVTSGKIKSSTIQSSDIRNGSVTGADVKDGSVSGTDLQDGSVGGADVQDGSLSRGDFAAGQLAPLPGGSSNIHWVKLNNNGATIAKSSGVGATTRLGTGSYRIELGFDPRSCATIATTALSYVAAGATSDATNVFLVTRDLLSAGQPTADVASSLTIIC